MQFYFILFLAVVLGGLYLLSTPYFSSKLLAGLERFGPLDPATGVGNAGAIVILAADYTEYAPEFGCQTVGPRSLERLRYGAWLHEQTGLPILVAGGLRLHANMSLAEALRIVLNDEFKVPVTWTECESMNTIEHAQKIPLLLAADGIDEVLLVTHAWHMARAVSAFEHFGQQKVIPAPTIFEQTPTPLLVDFRLGPSGLYGSYMAIYERLALVWYRYRYFGAGRSQKPHATGTDTRSAAGNEEIDPGADCVGAKNR